MPNTLPSVAMIMTANGLSPVRNKSVNTSSELSGKIVAVKKADSQIFV